MKVKCPTCGKAAEFVPANKYRPFCSERCATLDLGAWADEKYKVPATSNADDDSDAVNENTENESDPLVELPPKDHQN